MQYSIAKPFAIDIQNARRHPQLTNSDMRAIKLLKESGKYKDWNTLFNKFMEDLEAASKDK